MRIMKVINWLSHLEYDWNCPAWRPWQEEFSRFHTLYPKELSKLSLKWILSLRLDIYVQSFLFS